MKKYFITGALALVAMVCTTTSCQHDDISGSVVDAKIKAFDETFRSAYGDIDPEQTWGFYLGDDDEETRTVSDLTRSQSAPEVLGIAAPFDEAWVATYNQTAKEPAIVNQWDDNQNNVTDNYDNTTYATNWSVVNAIPWDGSEEDLLRQWFTNDKDGLGWDALVEWAKANRPNWIVCNLDQTFVRNFKITGVWNGGIRVAATEGYTDGVANGNERTVVVTGTWNITEDQKIGSLGKIIIAKGGTVNVASGKTLNMVNEARLVVLAGGKLTGDGKVEVNNGNAAGEENYNGGTIDVATFNNNFGKFYNYGKFLVNEYQGGAQESNFYNHSLVVIDHFGPYDSSTANARIFNKCQFYVKNDARIRNYEGVGGSALIVDGELMFSGSEDGTTTPSYVGLAAGALVQCGTLYNNGTSWTGPTENGYAALDIEDKITFLNWEQDAPQNGGYFENNIYVYAKTWDNIPGGNGWQAGETAIADYKFFHIVANALNSGTTVLKGNGNVKKVSKGNYEVIPASDDWKLGETGCTPGFKIEQETPGSNETEEVTERDFDERTVEVLQEEGRVFCEDLGQVSNADIDYNDVVFDAWVYVNKTYRHYYSVTKTVRKGTNEVVSTGEKVYDDEEVLYATTPSRTKIKLLAAGGTLQLLVAGEEVHSKFGVGHTTMVNTKTAASTFTSSVTTQEGLAPVEFQSATAYPNIISIPIVVRYSNGEIMELATNKGDAPHKFLVPIGTRWAAERCEISTAYGNFDDWVGNRDQTPWSSNINEGNLYADPNVQTATTEEASVAWSIDKTNKTFVGTIPARYFSSSASSISGGSATGTGSASAGDNSGINFLKIAPNTDKGEVTVTWTATVADGASFDLSSFSLRMARFGTDAGTVGVKVLVDGAEKFSIAGLIPARSNKTQADDKNGKEDGYTSLLERSVSGTATSTVQIVAVFSGIVKDKYIGFAEISISGTGTK